MFIHSKAMLICWDIIEYEKLSKVRVFFNSLLPAIESSSVSISSQLEYFINRLSRVVYRLFARIYRYYAICSSCDMMKLA